MTTLVLQAADSVIGGIAGTATSLAGSVLSGALSGGSGAAKAGLRVVEGPRLSEMGGLSSTEGARSRASMAAPASAAS